MLAWFSPTRLVNGNRVCRQLATQCSRPSRRLGPTASSKGAPKIAAIDPSADSSAMAPRNVENGKNERIYGNALLHDFCLAIPYGLSLILMGFIAFATPGAQKYGAFVTGSGVAQMVLSSKSLSSWKEGRNHKVWTSVCLALCAGLTWVSVSLYRLGAFPFVSATTAALSGFMCAFLGSNLLLGGNKAPTKKSE